MTILTDRTSYTRGERVKSVPVTMANEMANCVRDVLLWEAAAGSKLQAEVVFHFLTRRKRF